MDRTDDRAEAAPAVRGPRCCLHDLRNLMCVISHQSEMGRYAANLEEAELRQILGRIHEAARLTFELIESKWAGSGEPERFDLQMVIEHVAEVAHGRAGQGARIRCVLPPNSVWIEGYPETLISLCLNLVLNAVDASPGGAVTLSVSSHAEAPPMADLVAGKLPQTPWVMLDVADDGPGIPAELRDRIWDRGVTTKGTNGSGEGLALVRRLVEEARAGIALGSDHAGRTSFRVCWPADATEVSQTRHPLAQRSPRAGELPQ